MSVDKFTLERILTWKSVSIPPLELVTEMGFRYCHISFHQAASTLFLLKRKERGVMMKRIIRKEANNLLGQVARNHFKSFLKVLSGCLRAYRVKIKKIEKYFESFLRVLSGCLRILNKKKKEKKSSQKNR